MRTHVRRAVLFSFTLAALPAFADAPAPAALDEKAIAKTNVCTDGKSHYVAIAPDENRGSQLYYGDGKTFTIVAHDASNMVSGTDFQDARFPNPTANSDFRGIDWRNYSSVDYDKDKKTCSIRCGERKQALTIVPAEDAHKMVASAKLMASPKVHEPYALARDDRGVYYYVDRGNTPDTRQSYRVFVGKKGALKLQKMRDIAADSEGEVFSTVSGDLRFITGSAYSWVQGKQKLTLVKLDVVQNLPLIYNTLGIYSGQRMGTPCDDF